MKYRILGKTGLRVSVLGYGASSLGSVFRSIDETEGVRSVRVAFDMGVNLFDMLAPIRDRTWPSGRPEYWGGDGG